jgi:hypothetical protein
LISISLNLNSKFYFLQIHDCMCIWLLQLYHWWWFR